MISARQSHDGQSFSIYIQPLTAFLPALERVGSTSKKAVLAPIVCSASHTCGSASSATGHTDAHATPFSAPETLRQRATESRHTKGARRSVKMSREQSRLSHVTSLDWTAASAAKFPPIGSLIDRHQAASQLERSISRISLMVSEVYSPPPCLS